MKLCNLLDVITGPTVIWISTEYEADGVFLGFAEDARIILVTVKRILAKEPDDGYEDDDDES